MDLCHYVAEVGPSLSAGIRDVAWATAGLQFARQRAAGGPGATEAAPPPPDLKSPVMLLPLLCLLLIPGPGSALHPTFLRRGEEREGCSNGARNQWSATGVEVKVGTLESRRLGVQLDGLSRQGVGNGVPLNVTPSDVIVAVPGSPMSFHPCDGGGAGRLVSTGVTVDDYPCIHFPWCESRTERCVGGPNDIRAVALNVGGASCSSARHCHPHKLARL